MALTDATRLANFSSGVGTDGTLDTNNLNISGVATAATLKVGSAITAFGGIVTATTFSGTLSGNATSATTATNAEGLTGTPDITIRNITGVAATFTGVVSYEDVNNVDSVGVVTARSGLNVVGGGATVLVECNWCFNHHRSRTSRVCWYCYGTRCKCFWYCYCCIIPRFWCRLNQSPCKW